jgi:5-hydroxyisourate hydrolase
MSPITTHVLDVSIGKPAAGVSAELELQDGVAWKPIGKGVTNSDGRIKDLLPDNHALKSGRYRLTFQTGAYFQATSTPGFYPEVAIVFEIRAPGEHYHVPLLLSPFGYSTYRGS